MPRITNTHLEAASSVELRGFGYTKVATKAALDAITGRPGEIYTVTADGRNYQWDDARSEWVRWERGYEEIDAAGSTPDMLLSAPAFELDLVRVANIGGVAGLAITYIALPDSDGTLQWVNEATGQPLTLSVLPDVLKGASYLLTGDKVSGSVWTPTIDLNGFGPLSLPSGATTSNGEIVFPASHTGILVPAGLSPTTSPWSIGLVVTIPATPTGTDYLFSTKDSTAAHGLLLEATAAGNFRGHVRDSGLALGQLDNPLPTATRVFVWAAFDGTTFTSGVGATSGSNPETFTTVDPGNGGRIFARLNSSNPVESGVLKAFVLDDAVAWSAADITAIEAALV